MNYKEIRKKSLEQLNKNKWVDVGVNFVYEAITSASSFVYSLNGESQIDFMSDSYVNAAMSSVASAFAIATTVFVFGPLAAGHDEYFLSVSRDEPKSFVKLFNGFKQYWKNVGAYMIRFLYIVLWTFCFLIPGIIKSYAYSMQFFVLQDHPEMTGKEAMLESERIMNGHKWQLFCLQLSYFGWILLSLLTFGILWFLKVGPWMAIANANFYNEIVGHNKKEQIEQ